MNYRSKLGAAVLLSAVTPASMPVFAQGSVAEPAAPPAIDWTEQVVALTGEGGSKFRVFARDRFSCEIAFYQDGVTPGFSLYQVPDVPASMAVYAPPEWMLFEGEQDFTTISARLTGEGDDQKVTLEINQMPFKRIETEQDGIYLSAKPSGFINDTLDGSNYMSFALAAKEGETEGEAEPRPFLQFKFAAQHSSQAAGVFRLCHDWIRQQPEWQRDFGPQ